MNTNQLKKFAQEARRKLLEQVGAKLAFVLTTDSAELREKTEQVKQLREELNRTTKEQLIEKVAYTWFNRLMALRFMDANDYQPLGIRVITPKDGYTTPELLDEAKRGNIPEELKLKRQKVYDILDNRIPSTNPQNEAFKELLIAACNHLNITFSFLFEKISDYTELLLPDDLTSDFSIVTDLRNGMPVEDCKDVEIIGWLYQFYISEKKDAVLGSKAKVKKEDIPAVTQLFTPRWIVEYMVQNTVGKLWLQNRPKSRLREHMPYFNESTSLTSGDYLKINSPEEIRLLDPASGSGHILVYAFDLFAKIYEEEGYNTNDIPKLIIEKNLFGFEIDERAAQLAGFALMMKAREYQRRALRKDMQPNIFCFQDLTLNNTDIKQVLNNFQIKVSNELVHDLIQMQQATNFGSLIIPHSNQSEIIQLVDKLIQYKSTSDIFQRNTIDALQTASNQLIRLSEKYHCIAANPPYMGGGNMNNNLSEFVKLYYPDGKADLMTCFMESSLQMLMDNGVLGMINLPSWLFLSSFSKLRVKLIKNKHFDSLLHMGRGIFGIDWGSTAFIIANQKSNTSGKYFRLHQKNFQHIYANDIRDIYLKAKRNNDIKINFEKYREEQELRSIEELVDVNGSQIAYNFNQKDFEKIPDSPIVYWLSENILDIFEKNQKLGDKIEAKQGLATGNNERFLRFSWEVSNNLIGRFCLSAEEGRRNGAKWFPINKGGSVRKWYGNVDNIIAFDKLNRDFLKELGNHLPSENRYFHESISWSDVSSSINSFRYYPNGFLFDATGHSAFPKDILQRNIILGYCNSLFINDIANILNPTLHFHVGYFNLLPYPQKLFREDLCNNLSSIVESSIEIAKEDWDTKETSWHFRKNELVRLNNKEGLELQEAYDLFKHYWGIKFCKLHKYEESLNLQIINTYDLQKDVEHKVPLEIITILQEELDTKALIKQNKRLVRDPQTKEVSNYQEIQLPVIGREVISQFISYAVGCMFGRYGLDKEGLLLASQGFTLNDYLHIISKSKSEVIFLPDEDNIIPLLEDEWFEDDITGRFHQFLKVTFGEKNFSKNMAFIEEQLGKDIRKYFTKDFYPDHIKRYKKRPIYWMFSSLNCSFNVMIYMHRYTPDTVSNILNKYLKEFIGKLKTRKEHLQHIQITGSPAEKTKALKEDDNIDKMLIELQEYERDILFPMATERIAINLDDGVLVNYNKFGKAIKEVAGLNDKVTKKKVKEFDWIDTTQIR